MYAREKSRYLNEQFIEIFDLDLVTLPRDLPPWFIEQMQMLVRCVCSLASALYFFSSHSWRYGHTS